MRWYLAYSPSERTIRIARAVGYCVGAPKPWIGKVRTRERDRAVIVTAFLDMKRASAAKNPTCAGVELNVEKTVQLPSDLDGRALYDGSTSPPKKRWTRSGKE